MLRNNFNDNLVTDNTNHGVRIKSAKRQALHSRPFMSRGGSVVENN
jgi:hypothetical protein